MNRLTSLGILVAVGLLSGALGFWTRTHSQRATAPLNSASTDTTRARDSGASSNNSAQAVVSVSPRMVQFRKDVAMSTGVTRWLHWMEAIENADAADFAELSRMAEGDPQLFQLVVARWSERYPKQMFETLAARVRAGGNNPWEALNTLFGNWAKMNAAEMMENLDSIPDFGARSGWRMQAVNYAMLSDVELGLRYLAQWNIENYSPDMSPVAKWAAANPTKAAQFVLDNPAGAATESALRAVAREWARQDPVAALAFAKQNGGALSSTMARATMAQWAEENIDGASAWLAKATPAARNELSDTLIEKWANRDLNGAMEWAQKNLIGGDLSRAVASVIRGAADVNVANAANLVENMPASVARSEAAAAVAKRWFPASFQNDAPPADAIRWLGILDNESARRAITEVSWQWQETDSSGMADFLEKRNVEGLPKYIYSNLARALTRRDPIGALEWTARLPGTASVEAGNEAFMTWRQSQPEAASDWLAHVDSDDPRRKRFFQNTIEDLAGDPKKSELLAQFAALDPENAARIINDSPLPDDRRNAALTIVRAR